MPIPSEPEPEQPDPAGESSSEAPNPAQREERSEENGSSDWDEAVASEFLDSPADVDSHAPRIGPGFLEAIVWIVGLLVVEYFISLAWGVFAVLVKTATVGQPLNRDEITALITNLAPYTLGVVQAVAIVVVLVAIRLRYGRPAFRLTGFRLPSGLHLVIAAVAVIPTGVLCGQCYALLIIAWHWLLQFLPGLEALSDLSSMKRVQEMVEATPWYVLIVSVGIMPALNEEFFFRGLLGRGLVGRYGIVAGVALTSLLFAAMHISPPQALALIPLAVLLHMALLSSGSIAVPIFIHFANNALSVLLMIALAWLQEPASEGELLGSLDQLFNPYLFFTSAWCLAAIVWLLWRIRIRWRLPDGREWIAPVPGAAGPPRSTEAAATIESPGVAPVVFMLVGLVLFAATYLFDIVRLTGQAVGG